MPQFSYAKEGLYHLFLFIRPVNQVETYLYYTTDQCRFLLYLISIPQWYLSTLCSQQQGQPDSDKHAPIKFFSFFLTYIFEMLLLLLILVFVSLTTQHFWTIIRLILEIHNFLKLLSRLINWSLCWVSLTSQIQFWQNFKRLFLDGVRFDQMFSLSIVFREANHLTKNKIFGKCLFFSLRNFTKSFALLQKFNYSILIFWE